VLSWLLDKVSIGMRATINEAILIGDGLGKPLGLLHQKSGIPVCETSPSTPPNQFTWQDLIMLKYEIPMQWQNGASFLMNQRTFALLLTMSDAGGRPM
jgi:HK97 family phage major capsid protein